MSTEKNMAELLGQNCHICHINSAQTIQKGFYFCQSVCGQYRFITTNDKSVAEQLLAAGGVVICHPQFFSVISNHQNEVKQLVPFVIRLARIQRGNPDRGQDNSTDTCESSLATFY